MEQHKFGKRSVNNLIGVHPILVAFAFDLLYQSPFDIGISDGVRTKAEQKVNVKNGVSWTMDSKHRLRVFEGIETPVAGAFDLFILINGKAVWTPDTYEMLRPTIIAVESGLGAPIVWGADWKTKDYPHIELAEESVLWEQ